LEARTGRGRRELVCNHKRPGCRDGSIGRCFTVPGGRLGQGLSRFERDDPNVLRSATGVGHPDHCPVERHIETIIAGAGVDRDGLLRRIRFGESHLHRLADRVFRLVGRQAVGQVRQQRPQFQAFHAQGDLASHLRVLSLGFAGILVATCQ
jgi:hypothetical protein